MARKKNGEKMERLIRSTTALIALAAPCLSVAVPGNSGDLALMGSKFNGCNTRACGSGTRAKISRWQEDRALHA
jgi:hypothetical protein